MCHISEIKSVLFVSSFAVWQQWFTGKQILRETGGYVSPFFFFFSSLLSPSTPPFFIHVRSPLYFSLVSESRKLS